jgi:hypothetical protein
MIVIQIVIEMMFVVDRFLALKKKNRWERIVCGAVLDWSAIEKSSDVLIHSCSGDGLCCFINKIS